MEINEVEKSIERYMKIYNQIQSNIDAKQLALNDQSSKKLFANGKLTIDQMNEIIEFINDKLKTKCPDDLNSETILSLTDNLQL